MTTGGVIKKFVSLVANVVAWGTLSVVLCFVARIFVVDTFPVNSHSMSPTIIAGDKVLVDKFIFGARIYKNIDFLGGAEMESFRMNGLRKIRHGDIVVFNHRTAPLVKFVINSVYVKRCIGLPGDTISIVDGVYRNSSVDDTLGLHKLQERLNDAELSAPVLHVLNYALQLGWTAKEFGPLPVPRRGDVVALDRRNIALFSKYIRYEQGDRYIPINDSTALIDGAPAATYRFERNYYFMAGDNVFDSHDSRYFGLIPEEFIIGVAPVILRSRDHSGRMRWERFLKRI